ncbi:MAG: PRC-barrel domain-containing protein [Bryobacterales bacterium]|nr:PRC-barrel domain-containing protein [Bryobacterales bacterium]
MTQAGAARAVGKSEQTLRTEGVETHGDPHLRSVREVSGYRIRAADGEIGRVADFIVDTDGWAIRYLVVDTRNWLPGRKVLVAPRWVQSIDWGDRLVHVRLHREDIKNSPEFDPNEPVNREYEARLYDYYGRPRYW